MVSKSRFIPVLGDGRWISAPVYVGDVSEAIIACIETPTTIGRNYDIGGPTLVQFDELVDRIGTALGRRPLKLHVPLSVSLRIAGLAARLPKPPITLSNVLGSNQDTCIDITPARRDFRFEPRPLDAAFEIVVATCRREQAHDAADAASWTRDCSLLSRYLIGCEPSAGLVERYRSAVDNKLAGLDLENADWRWARRHHRCIPYLDAAAALVHRRRSALRARLYLLTALLETEPVHADKFLPRVSSRVGLLGVLAWQATRTGVNALIGIPLLAWARRFG
jgi:hypothetical protein